MDELNEQSFWMEEEYIYYSDAKKDLEEYGVFAAIREIVEYEKENYGEVLADFANPCNIANYLFCIIGYDTLSFLETYELYWDVTFTDEIKKEIIAEINEILGVEAESEK